MLKHFLCQVILYGGKTVSKERTNRSTNNGNMAETAKGPGVDAVRE